MSDATELQEQEAEATQPTPAPGEVLAEARRSQRLSVGDIASRLKLSVSQVEALEKGAYERLPGPVFVRGFARNYARLLKLDPDEIMQAIDARLPRASAGAIVAGDMRIPMPTNEPVRWPLYVGIVVLVFLGAALAELLWPERTVPLATVPSPVHKHVLPPAAAQGSGSAPAAAKPSGNTSELAGAAPASAAAPAATPAPKTVAPAPAAPSAAPAPAATAAAGQAQAQAAQPSATTSVAAPLPGQKQLQLVFKQQSWVQIIDGQGNTLMSRLNAAGTTGVVNATPPVSVVIGNAHHVRLTVDGKPVDLTPYTRVDVARLTLK